MDLIVKICGLSTEATLDAALAAGADMVGFVFFPKSPRFISFDKAAMLAKQARGRAGIVALAVDMDDAALGDIVDAVKPDWLQLHGQESVEARRRGPQAVRLKDDEGGRRRQRRRPRAGNATPPSPTGCCSTPSRRRTPPARAATRGPSTGAFSPVSNPACRIFFRAA